MRIIIPLSLRWHLLMVQIRNLIKYVICFRSTVPLRREILLFLHFWRSIAKSLFPQTQFRSYPQFKQRIKKTVWNYGNNFSHTSGRLFHLLSTKTFNDTNKECALHILAPAALLSASGACLARTEVGNVDRLRRLHYTPQCASLPERFLYIRKALS